MEDVEQKQQQQKKMDQFFIYCCDL